MDIEEADIDWQVEGSLQDLNGSLFSDTLPYSDSSLMFADISAENEVLFQVVVPIDEDTTDIVFDNETPLDGFEIIDQLNSVDTAETSNVENIRVSQISSQSEESVFDGADISEKEEAHVGEVHLQSGLSCTHTTQKIFSTTVKEQKN